jgi:c-di-GMP-binding flagellar brake protein YcgR
MCEKATEERMQEKEKRQSQRSVFRQSLEYELSTTHPAAASLVGRGQGLDISSGGVGMETEDALQKGEVVKLLIPLGREGTNIPVLAAVRWVAPLGEKYRMGLQFLA